MPLVGSAPAIERARADVRQAASERVPVLLWGETGVGKTMCAKWIAEQRGPSAVIVEHVDRLTEPKQYELLVQLDRTDALIVATSACGLNELDALRWGPELVHRIAVLDIELPPLRQSPESIAELVAHFEEAPLPQPLLRRFQAYDWPGNVRELRGALHRQRLGAKPVLRNFASAPPPVSLREAEAKHIAATLEAVGWNKTRAAELLGIQRSTLYQKIREHELRDPVRS
ncbi:MAG: helix-turn-helix domain-containing protein [Myxococcota bacterium]